jgi:hypothetical protein
MKSFKQQSSAIALTVAATLLAANSVVAAAAMEKPGPKSETIVAGWEDPVMPDVAASSGRALLRHLESAKAYLATNSVTGARSALRDSAEFASAIRLMMPYEVVTDQIENAKQHVVDTSIDVFYADLLPIYGSLDELDVYAPKVAEKAREGVKKAEQHAKAGNRKAAANQLQNVVDEFSQTTVYLPIGYVSDQIRAAETALDKKQPDLTTAKKAVNNALGSLAAVVDKQVVESQKKG